MPRTQTVTSMPGERRSACTPETSCRSVPEPQSADVATRSGDGRFLTIKGPPGVGKTLLALHLAARMAVTYGNKVVFVDLSDCNSSGDVERQISSRMGLMCDRGASLAEVLENRVGSERL